MEEKRQRQKGAMKAYLYAPKAPGAYLMKDGEGKALYVGKAKNIRSRIRAYFAGTDSRFMTPFLLSRVHDVEFIITKTEKEALILENTLIKEHRPRYNVNFRDDKAYFHIKIDLRENFPLFQLVRRPLKDGAKYFGPYPSSASAKETLLFIQKIFPLRTCSDTELKNRERPCMEYEIGRCLAPCAALIDKVSYHKLVKDSVAFLEGKGKGLLAELRRRMKTAAERLDFEQAASLRDRIAAIANTLERQQVVSMSAKDQDIFGIVQEGDLSHVCVLFIREGKLLGKKDFPLIKIPADPAAEILSSVIKQYYDGEAAIPDEILVPLELEDKRVIREWLSDKKGHTVSIVAPNRGRGRELLDMARQNSENTLKAEQQNRQDKMKAIHLLAQALQLKKLPARVECFDISNIGGSYAVGAMVTFVEGKPYKNGYRRFRIKKVTGMDDYSMMHEVLSRRYCRKDDLPDLIMLDGGKGQLGVALAVLKDLSITDTDVIALAKGSYEDESLSRSRTSTLHKGEDRVYLPRRKDPLYLSKWPPALFLLQQIRDEAHRFALSYCRKVKEQEDFLSVLDEIGGIGQAKKKALLLYLGDIKRVREASLEELRKVDGIGKALAGKIYTFLHGAEKAL